MYDDVLDVSFASIAGINCALVVRDSGHNVQVGYWSCDSCANWAVL